MAPTGSWTCRRSSPTSCAGRWTTGATTCCCPLERRASRVQGGRPDSSQLPVPRPEEAATRAAPTTPTTSSPQPPKASTPPARASAGPSTSPPNHGPASRSAAATGEHKAADMADGTWPNLTGKFKPHDYRHTHATWLDDADLSKVIQMDRRGHAMPGMDRVYIHVTRRDAPAPLRRPRGAMARRRRPALRDPRPLTGATAGSHPANATKPPASAILPLKVPLAEPRTPSTESQNEPLTCGAPLRNRTVDLLLTMETLCRLS